MIDEHVPMVVIAVDEICGRNDGRIEALSYTDDLMQQRAGTRRVPGDDRVDAPVVEAPAQRSR